MKKGLLNHVKDIDVPNREPGSTNRRSPKKKNKKTSPSPVALSMARLLDESPNEEIEKAFEFSPSGVGGSSPCRSIMRTESFQDFSGSRASSDLTSSQKIFISLGEQLRRSVAESDAFSDLDSTGWSPGILGNLNLTVSPSFFAPPLISNLKYYERLEKWRLTNQKNFMRTVDAIEDSMRRKETQDLVRRESTSKEELSSELKEYLEQGTPVDGNDSQINDVPRGDTATLEAMGPLVGTLSRTQGRHDEVLNNEAPRHALQDALENCYQEACLTIDDSADLLSSDYDPSVLGYR